MRFRFRFEEVKPLIEHSLRSTPGGMHPKPHILLVSDDGVYLMSGAKEPLRGEADLNRVAFAEDHGSGTFLDGDDFGHVIECDPFIKQLLNENPEFLDVRIGELTLTLEGIPFRK